MTPDPPAAPGRRTGCRVVIPPDRLDSRRIWSREARRLDGDQVSDWNRRHAGLLEIYGLEIASITVLPIAPIASDRGRAGPLQTDHRDRLILAGALGALAVSASGRGDLLALAPPDRSSAKRRVKENNDRNSTGAMTEALHALCEADPGARLRVAIGEGARRKPGERGGNPTLFAGQVLGAGAREYAVAVDTVEGTSKSTLFDPSCGTLLFVTEAPIPTVPDVYFDKCQIWDVDEVTVGDPLERIIEAVRDRRRSREVDFFSLDRPRHPIDSMVSRGANMRVDSDVDAYPAIAAGLRWGVFPDNHRPLDGVCANIGGAAEMIASAAGASYLGVRSTGRFCAAEIPRWEERYDFGPGEEDRIREAGFDPGRIYRIEDLVPGIETADGALIAGAISDNWHIPALDAVLVGGNFATVSTLFVGSATPAAIWRITFSYRGAWEETVRALTPELTRLLALPGDRIAGAVATVLADPRRARRLRHEIATSFYTHREAGSTAGGIGIDLAAAEASESPEAVALLRAVSDAEPDWFA